MSSDLGKEAAAAGSSANKGNVKSRKNDKKDENATAAHHHGLQHSVTWDLERPPIFHCPRLMVRINEMLPPGDNMLMTEQGITKLDTHECRELARKLSYFGRVRFQGVKTISSSGSKIDMQRRIVTWNFCYNRQLQGLHPLPDDYEAPTPEEVNEATGGAAVTSTATTSCGSAAKRPAKRKRAADEEDNETIQIRAPFQPHPILPEFSSDELLESTSNLKLLLDGEHVNKLRGESMAEITNLLKQLYETRRQLFAELSKLDWIVDDNTKSAQYRDRARQRSAAEESSLAFVQEQITSIESMASTMCKKKPL